MKQHVENVLKDAEEEHGREYEGEITNHCGSENCDACDEELLEVVEKWYKETEEKEEKV